MNLDRYPSALLNPVKNVLVPSPRVNRTREFGQRERPSPLLSVGEILLKYLNQQGLKGESFGSLTVIMGFKVG